jgi:tight adherence protein B
MLLLASMLGVVSFSLMFWLFFRWTSGVLQHQHGRLTQRLDAHLASGADPYDLRSIMAGIWILASVPAVAVYLFTHHAWLSAITLSAGLITPGFVIRVLRRRRLALIRRQLPDLLTIMAGSLRAGISLQQTLVRGALSVEAPLRVELGHVQRELRLGLNFAQALASLERRVLVEEVTLLVLIQSLGEVLRRKLALESKIRALTAQGRLQATVMCFLPLVLLVLLSWIDPTSAADLLTTFNGQLALALTAVLQIIGVLLIRRIIAIEV